MIFTNPVPQHVYRILLNKRACLNKCVPDFLLGLAVSQKLLIRSESSFQHLKLRFQGSILQVSSISDKGKGSFSVSAPGAFIRRNTVLLNEWAIPR